MSQQPLTFVATSDVSGLMRGKAFPTRQLQQRSQRGVGWTPTNVQITCFNSIAESPYGSLGDLALVPDLQTEVHVYLEDGEQHLMLGNILNLDGSAWECCTRGLLQSALERLFQLSGAVLCGAFEHEFQLKGLTKSHGGFTYKGFRDQQLMGEKLIWAIEQAGLQPDTFLKEYGANQYEVTLAPEQGVKIADGSAFLRELIYSTASSLNTEATLTPIRDLSGVGNGVHIHLSFLDQEGIPLTYCKQGSYGMSDLTSHFIAGVLKYLPQIVAFTAPSAISYFRLTPHRWSASYNNLGFRDREAAVRICPVVEFSSDDVSKQYHFEFRAADAAASPHLALAAIVHAGCQGIEERLSSPSVTQEDLSLLDKETLQQQGFSRLPQSLQEALDTMLACEQVKSWFSPNFVEVYRQHKLGELAFLEGKAGQQLCQMYEEVY